MRLRVNPNEISHPYQLDEFVPNVKVFDTEFF